jgi:phosphatidylglycerol:prolipoprotein diacylglycerol transferase
MKAGDFFTLLAYVAGAAVFYLAARRRSVATEGMGALAIAGLAGGVVGARLTEWLLTHPSGILAQPGVLLDPRLGGRTIIGGLVCGWIAVEIAKRRMGITRSTGDLFALALPAGEAVGRIGCFFNGCCFGVTSDAPWAVYQHGAWRHPAQLYTSVVALGIFVVLWNLRDRMPGEGDLFKVYIALFGASRFLLEFLRERTLASRGLSTAQWVCLELAAGGIIMLYLSAKRRPVAVAAQ